jgi:hypothetical protein
MLLFLVPVAVGGAVIGAIVSTNRLSGAGKGAVYAVGTSLVAGFVLNDTDGFTLPSKTLMPEAHNTAKYDKRWREAEERAAVRAAQEVVQ